MANFLESLEFVGREKASGPCLRMGHGRSRWRRDDERTWRRNRQHRWRMPREQQGGKDRIQRAGARS